MSTGGSGVDVGVGIGVGVGVGGIEVAVGIGVGEAEIVGVAVGAMGLVEQALFINPRAVVPAIFRKVLRFIYDSRRKERVPIFDPVRKL